MDKNPKPYDMEPMETPRACEPAAPYDRAFSASEGRRQPYHVTDTERESILRAREQYTRGEFYTEEQMDRIVEEWLS